MSNGMKSSEFLLIVVATIVAAYLAKLGVGVDVIGAVVAGPSAYALSRGMAKSEPRP